MDEGSTWNNTQGQSLTHSSDVTHDGPLREPRRPLPSPGRLPRHPHRGISEDSWADGQDGWIACVWSIDDHGYTCCIWTCTDGWTMDWTLTSAHCAKCFEAEHTGMWTMDNDLLGKMLHHFSSNLSILLFILA